MDLVLDSSDDQITATLNRSKLEWQQLSVTFQSASKLDPSGRTVSSRYADAMHWRMPARPGSNWTLQRLSSLSRCPRSQSIQTTLVRSRRVLFALRIFGILKQRSRHGGRSKLKQESRGSAHAVQTVASSTLSMLQSSNDGTLRSIRSIRYVNLLCVTFIAEAQRLRLMRLC